MRPKLLLFFGLYLVLFQSLISYPVAIWETNKFNVEAPLTNSTSVIGAMFLAVIILAALTAFLLPKKIATKLLPPLTIFVCLIFIQQNFLTWDYGILDGQNLDFKKNNYLGLIDLSLWTLGLFSVFFVSKLITKQILNILLTIGLIVTITTGTKFFGYGKISTHYSIDETAKFDFSRNENIVVFLFDAYQMDIFLEISDKFPELMKPFEGFTLYENNSAVFAKTYPTIPLFLTGKRYNKEQPILDFFETTYEDSYLQEMKANGWDIGLYPNIKSYPSLTNAVDISPKTMNNIVSGISETAKVSTYWEMIDLSLFRAVPHHIKPIIYNNGNFIIGGRAPNSFRGLDKSSQTNQPFIYKSKQKHGALGFRELINDHGALKIDSPAFRFYHFAIPHAPNTLDENLLPVRHVENFEAYRSYSIAAVKLMGSYLTTLKKIGAYENATILILSDHGMGVRHKFQYNSENKSYEELDKFALHRSAAKSITLMKEPGSMGPLKRSQKPISGIDIAPTLAVAAGLSAQNFEGFNIPEIPDTSERERLFNYYAFSTWDSKYLNHFEQFKINGDVREDDSWALSGKIKADIQLKNKEEYTIGEILSFGNDIKSDSDFLNAFIDGTKYALKSSHIVSQNGTIDIDIKLDRPLSDEDFLLLQFEIYSGAAKKRKIIVNDNSFEAFIKPRKRFLNQGFYISPQVHKNRKDFQLSFRPVDPATTDPLRLSTVKLSKILLEYISTDDSLIKNIRRFYPTDTNQQKSKKELVIDKSLSLVFGTSKNLCLENKLMIKIKGEEGLPPSVQLNDNLLKGIDNNNPANKNTLFFECHTTNTIQPNILNLSYTPSYSNSVEEKYFPKIIIQDIRFKSNVLQTSK